LGFACKVLESLTGYEVRSLKIEYQVMIELMNFFSILIHLN
jgi:hypothetical protein